MKHKSLLLLPILALSMSSCSLNGAHHDISEYILDKKIEVDVTKDFNILQLTDLHLGDKDDLDVHFKFMDLTINDANPDMIVVTGDLFTFTGKDTAKRLFHYLDSKKVPWTVTFGNHDEQTMFSVDWLTSTLNTWGSYCYFKDIQGDDVNGYCNFAINVVDKNDNTKIHEQIIVMDSNRYSFGSYWGYDYFKKDQIDWYKSLIDYSKAGNGGDYKSLMFYHIPLPEVNQAYDEAKAGGTIKYGEKREKSCPPDYNSGFFEVIKGIGSTQGMYFGHDHINDFIVNYQGIDFGYGLKSTDRVYFDKDMLGGTLITVKPDQKLEYKLIKHTYQELEAK